MHLCQEVTFLSHSNLLLAFAERQYFARVKKIEKKYAGRNMYMGFFVINFAKESVGLSRDAAAPAV